MSTPTSRPSALIGTLLLAACGPASDGGDPRDLVQRTGARITGWFAGEADDRPRVHCASAADRPLAADCRLERLADADGMLLILSRPDGGFRRLRMAADGALSAADGAIEARSVRTASAIGVAIGAERYAVPLGMLANGSAP
jgi:hypothetical protein